MPCPDLSFWVVHSAAYTENEYNLEKNGREENMSEEDNFHKVGNKETV